MELTAAEKVFIQRMAFYVEKGYSFEEAGKSVLADDAKIFNHTFNENTVAEKTKKALCADVFFSIKKDVAINEALTDDASDMVTEEIRQMVLEG